MNPYILVWSVCTFVETHVQEEIHLEELACLTGFSLAHIRDVFRKNTGHSLSRYIQERKIANAAQSLLYTDDNIIDIAIHYGYSGRTVFSRAFRRFTGYTPSQFRTKRSAIAPIRLCAGIFGPDLPRKQEDIESKVNSSSKKDICVKPENSNTTILYGVPKVAYGEESSTPFPMCVRSCANYLGLPVDYTQIMVESGSAFRLVWDTACWNGSNVDAVFTFDQPEKTLACGMRVMGQSLKILRRTPETKKETFTDFIRTEIDSGHPVIALGIIGPPEACVIAGYQDSGDTLLGWNVFQEYPEYQAQVQFEQNGYFITKSWWENPSTEALIATEGDVLPPLSPKEILQNAAEALKGRMCMTQAKGILAYDAWKDALLHESDFPRDAVLPVLVERMMCHGDAMDCLSDGRHHAAIYLRRLAEKYPAQAEKLNRAAQEFEHIIEILWKEMIPVLGGWGRSEKQVRQLAKLENRHLFSTQIDRMKSHDQRAYTILCELAEEL
ncbi:MAG: helix-turn-helix domain-containing protein [Lachnospiraceae bacterium]|nr:helix-turn-helix domain-containing protein [Lachnospiraceae bacterium]